MSRALRNNELYPNIVAPGLLPLPENLRNRTEPTKKFVSRAKWCSMCKNKKHYLCTGMRLSKALKARVPCECSCIPVQTDPNL